MEQSDKGIFVMKQNDIEELVILQRRGLSLLCSAILLIIGLSFVAVPILTFFIPIEATYEEQLYFRIFSFIMALVLGCPLIVMSICLLANVRHKVAIRVNKEGIYIHTDAFKKGFISWTAVEYMRFHKSYMTGRYARTLEVILNTDEKPTLRINAVWRLESNVLLTKNGQCLLIPFSFCKGGAKKNAINIISFWESLKRETPMENVINL